MIPARRWITIVTNGLTKFIGIALLLFAVLAIVQGVLSLRIIFKQGRVGFSSDIDFGAEKVSVRHVYPDSPAEKAGLKAGDVLLKINGQSFTIDDYNRVTGDAVAGSDLTVTVRRGDRVLDIQMTRKLIPLIERVINVLYLLILPFLMLAYILVGLWGLFKQPSYITKLIALVCFAFGSLTTSINIQIITTPLSRYLLFYEIKNIVSLVALVAAPAFWLLLFVNFPRKTEFYRRHQVLTLFLIFVYPVVILTTSLFDFQILGNQLMLIVYLAYLFVFLTLGIVIFTRGARRLQTVLERRQYKLIRFGIKYGSLAILAGFLLLGLYSVLQNLVGNYLGWFVFLFFLVSQFVGLMLPFTFLNSFFQNRILETEAAMKRRLAYIAASFGLFTLYLVVAFLIGRWLITRYQLEDPSFIVLTVLVLSLTFAPINRWIQRRLEEKLYPEKTKYRASLREFIQRLSSTIEEKQILDSLSKWITETMGIAPIVAFSLDSARDTGAPLRLKSRKGVASRTRKGGNFYWDEVLEDPDAQVDESERRWAREKGISITVPMISRGEQVGLLNIGKKRNNQDFTGDDLDIFREAATHSATAIQNIKLQAEHLDKLRLDKELEVARNIQTHLLPKEIPNIPGLQLAGEYHPCLEVGGDYFDIIPIDRRRTALVIADVSGKGAGAALLMSSLQASLKMAISLDLRPEEIVQRINSLIFGHSLPSQFITFFLGIWDSEANQMEYINAGHNPPIVLDREGGSRRLRPTGPGLGLKRNQKYRSRRVTLNIQDLLAIFTDGIEELFNARLEAYGLNRMIAVLLAHRDKHPREIITRLMASLREFSKNPHFCDDVSIIVAKRIA